MPAGRPTIFTHELGDAMCERIADGESMRSVCRDESMPAKSTVFRWLREMPVFKDQYLVAKLESADSHVDDMIDIADNGTNDWMEKNATDEQKAVYKLNGESVQRSMLRVRTRQWASSRINKTKYGDSKELTHKTDGPIEIQRSSKDLAKELAFLLAQGANDK